MRASHGALALAALVAGLALATPALAQGSLGGQGFGYPPGALGPRASATGGAVAEQDPTSPVNPAALGEAARSSLFFQYSPEFRSLDAGGATERTTTLRFPLVGGIARVGERARFGLTAANFLDRTWSTRSTTTQILAGDTITSTDRFASQGGMTDVRAAGSWSLGKTLLVGVGIHAITGENRITVGRDLADTLAFSLENRTIGYTGGALSAGAVWRVSRLLSVAGSARRGTDLRARSGDTLLAKARVPDRLGAGLLYTGITGTTLAARAEWTGWTSMQGLASSAVSTFDSWETGLGAEIAGPRFGDRVSQIRAGGRWRTLPFGVGGKEVRELELSTGFGMPLAYERSSVDLGIQRAWRDAGDLRERAWILTLGVSVRP